MAAGAVATHTGEPYQHTPPLYPKICISVYTAAHHTLHTDGGPPHVPLHQQEQQPYCGGNGSHNVVVERVLPGDSGGVWSTPPQQKQQQPNSEKMVSLVLEVR